MEKWHQPVFSTEALLDTEYVTKGRQTGFEIQLGTLREECRLTVIFQLEECCATLYLGLYQTRWCYLQKVVLCIRCTESREKCCTKAEHRRGDLATENE